METVSLTLQSHYIFNLGLYNEDAADDWSRIKDSVCTAIVDLGTFLFGEGRREDFRGIGRRLFLGLG